MKRILTALAMALAVALPVSAPAQDTLPLGDISAYLNGIEKLNCVYCGYANGMIAYVREIAGRTEQYWCPIKHARRSADPHDHFEAFIDYGDAETYRANLKQIRSDLNR
mgnify:FL=1